MISFFMSYGTIFNLFLFLFCLVCFEFLVKTLSYVFDVLFALMTFRFWIRNACIKGLEFARKKEKKEVEKSQERAKFRVKVSSPVLRDMSE